MRRVEGREEEEVCLRTRRMEGLEVGEEEGSREEEGVRMVGTTRIRCRKGFGGREEVEVEVVELMTQPVKLLLEEKKDLRRTTEPRWVRRQRGEEERFEKLFELFLWIRKRTLRAC